VHRGGLRAPQTRKTTPTATACGADVDRVPCRTRKTSRLDGDGLCADVDQCPADPENDADGDGLCADVDPCPDHFANDANGDGVCDALDELVFIDGFESGDASEWS